MGQFVTACATTNVRRQSCKYSDRRLRSAQLSQELGCNPKTVAKWRSGRRSRS